jgi:serine/threonine protein kinase
VTAASDVYGLALLLYRALTNDLPWPVETITEMIAAHTYAEPHPLPALEGLPDPVRDLVLRCLAKDPEERPSARGAAIVLAAAAGMAAPLGEEMTEASVVPPPPVDRPVPRRAPPMRRRGVVMISGAASALALAVLIPLALGGSGNDGSGPEVALPSASELTSSAPDPTDSAQAGLSVGTATPVTGLPGPPTADSGPDPVSKPGPTRLPTAPPPPPGGPQPVRFDTPGGWVNATCQPAGAYLVNGVAEPGFEARVVVRGPAQTAEVRFIGIDVAYRLRVRCPGGVPTTLLQSTPRPPPLS